MARIHPSAIVDPRAELAADVEIGPWCRIDGPVTLGEGCRLHERVSLTGPLRAGKRNIFYPGAVIGLEPQDRKFNPARMDAGIVLGDDNLFREGVTIHRATKEKPTTIGHRNFFMVNTHAGHDCVIGNDCTLANGALLAGHVELADRVTLGGNAVVHQFCRLGRLSMISGGAGTVQDVPPFCVIYTIRWVGSLNLVGLRRSGLSGSIDAIKAAFDILYCRRLPNKRAAETIDAECGHDPNCAEFAAFVRSTRRGVTPYLRAGRAARKTDDTTLGE